MTRAEVGPVRLWRYVKTGDWWGVEPTRFVHDRERDIAALGVEVYIAHPAAASAESIRAEVIEEAARYAAAYVVSRTVVFPQSGAIVAEAVRLTALHFSARATKEL